MTVELERSPESKGKKKKAGKKEISEATKIRQMKEEIQEKIKGPCMLAPDGAGQWWLIISPPRAKGLGLKRNKFKLEKPLDALQTLINDWPKTN
ncbi:MAG: hypothetical protein PHD51_04420 [Patescibacteria group bacterium]|nr:hypothetical protein [Patescibacteria group bacterium]MDD5490772.1 hypothetical protein [Patescibacteria group bacterium]